MIANPLRRVQINFLNHIFALVVFQNPIFLCRGKVWWSTAELRCLYGTQRACSTYRQFRAAHRDPASSTDQIHGENDTSGVVLCRFEHKLTIRCPQSCQIVFNQPVHRCWIESVSRYLLIFRASYQLWAKHWHFLKAEIIRNRLTLFCLRFPRKWTRRKR